MKQISLTILAMVHYICTIGQITSVTPIGTQIGKYNKFELKVELSETFDNPYDPDVIDMTAEYISPSGKLYTSIGFYYEEFSQDTTQITGLPHAIEELSNTGNSDWRIRFAPNETGTWQYKIHVNTANGLVSYPENSYNTFTCVNSTNPGFVRKRDSRYLEHDNGELYFPIGMNYPSYENYSWRSSYSYGTCYYDDKFELFENNNINYVRMFADFVDGLSLYGYDFQDQQMYYDNKLNLKDAWQLDHIVSEAEKKGIYIQMCLFDYQNLSDDSFTWGKWSGTGCEDTNGDHKITAADNCGDYTPYLYNPFNADFGGDLNSPEDFFALRETNAIRIQENIIRYFIARWGYSTSILSWELFNEAEQFANFTFNHKFYDYGESASDITLYNIKKWHYHMMDYIDLTDDFDHLMTTSFAGQPSIFNDIMNYMDYMQFHSYTNIINYKDVDNQSKFYDQYSNNSGKKVPLLVGETGDECQGVFKVNGQNYRMDPNGFELHNMMWAATFSGHMGIPSMWYRDYIAQENLFSQYSSISQFISNIGDISEEYMPVHKTQNGLRGYFLQSDEFITGWLQDEKYKTNNLITDYSNPLNNRYLYYLDESRRPSPSSSNNQFTVNNAQWGYYNVKWYNTNSNQLVHSEKVFSNGNLSISMPSSLRNSSTFGDAAFTAEFDCNTSYWLESALNGAAGHNVSGSLAISSTGTVFYKSSSNSINCIYYSNGKWNWSDLNGASGYNVNGDLAISSSGTVFYKTTDSSINCIYYSNGKWNWSGLNGAAGHNVSGSLAISSTGTVFYKTTDSSINCIYYSNGKWNWSGLNGAAGHNVSGAIAIDGSNQVFYKTTSKSINCIYYSNGKWNWSGLNGAAGLNVSGALTIDGSNKVFYKTTGNSINCIYYSNGKWNWSGLNNVADGITSGDLVASNDKVFFKATDNNVKAIFWDGSWKLDNLHNASKGNVGGSIVVTPSSNKVFYKTYGSSKSLYAIYWTNNCSLGSLKSATIDIEPMFDENFSTNNRNENSIVGTKDEILLFPNPSKDIVELKNIQGDIKVFNSLGAIIFSSKTINNQCIFNVQNWSKGVYIIEATGLNGKKEKKNLIVN